MSDPVHALVFTKQRPMQLHAFLESAQRYAPYASVSVLQAEPSRDDHGAYLTVQKAFRDYVDVWTWDDVGGFESQVRGFLRLHERVVFHTDDEAWFGTPDPGLLDADSSEVVVTFRQGRNTTFCHPLQCSQKVPEVFPWSWREAEHDFGYPLSLNACIYRSADLLPLMDFRFTNPTELEAQLACNARDFRPEWMTAPEHSCTVSLPHNRVTTGSMNPISSVPDWQPDALTDRYLQGWRIDLDALAYELVDAAHVELPLHFRKG